MKTKKLHRTRPKAKHTLEITYNLWLQLVFRVHTQIQTLQVDSNLSNNFIGRL